MSDFDKIFKDKLNEEDDFPRMEQNWQKLSARMKVADAPTSTNVPLKPHPKLTAWKWAVAATGLLLVSSNIWWWFHQKGQTTLATTPAVEQNSPSPISKTDTIYKIVYRDAELNKGENKDNLAKSDKVFEKIASETPPSVSKSFSTKKQAEQLVTKQNLAGRTPVFSTPIEKNTPIAEANKLGKKENMPLNSTPIPVENKAVKNETPPIASSEKSEVKKDIFNEKKEERNVTVLAENTKNLPLKTAEKDGEMSKNTENTEGGVKATETVSNVENTKIEGTEKPINSATKQNNDDTKIATTETPKADKITVESPINIDKKSENTGKPIADKTDNKQDIEAPAPPIVKPLKSKPKFSIGVNALVAFPKDKDLSALKAAGATLGVKVNDNVRVDLAGFSGEIDYKLKIHKPHWHIPKDPRDKPIGGPPRGIELREIKGKQVRQQVSLSLTYLFKSRGWLTPKAELGYAVQRIANQSAKFEFRDPVTGKEIYITELSAPRTFKNLWNLGFGVEKTFGHFTGNLTAAFQKDLSDKSVDMMVLRGGMRYSF
jgi:hypothetical protein